MGRCWWLREGILARFQQRGKDWKNLPSLTLTWVEEYPLVTFLTLRITLDMMGRE